MTVASITFYSVVLAVHIAAVVVAFGVMFAYPIFYRVVDRTDARAMPALIGAFQRIGVAIIFPASILVLVAGVYLVADSPAFDFSESWISVGFLVVIVSILLGPLFYVPTEKKMLELAERDVAAAGAGEATLSDEFYAVAARYTLVGRLNGLIVLVAIFFMSVRP